MHRILKVFCTGADQDRLAETLQVVARYEGFVIVEISEEKVADLAGRDVGKLNRWGLKLTF